MKRKAKKAKEKQTASSGGFTLASRGKVRKLGINVPVGDEYTCLPDACHTLMVHAEPNLGIKHQEVRAALRTDGQADANVSMAMGYVGQYGMVLRFRRELNSPVALFRIRAGAFLVRLKISTDEGTDHHFVAYLAEPGFLIDNYPGRPVPTIDDDDRSSNHEAMRVFHLLFPGANTIQMTSVYQLERAKATVVPPTTRSSFPTHDDLFIDLYDEGVISYAELVDCIHV